MWQATNGPAILRQLRTRGMPEMPHERQQQESLLALSGGHRETLCSSTTTACEALQPEAARARKEWQTQTSAQITQLGNGQLDTEGTFVSGAIEYYRTAR